MIRFVKEEIFKFRKEKIRYCLLVLCIPTIIVFLMYAFNEKYDLVEWDGYLNNIITFLNYIVCPIVYGIITAYTFGHEYETKTINILFTYPINRMKILMSKLLFIFLIIGSTLLSILLLSLGLGLLIKHESLTTTTFIYYLGALVKMMVFHFMLICIVSAVAISLKSVLPAIIFIISVSFANLVVVNTKIAVFYPWSAPILLSPHENVGRNYIPSFCCMLSLIIIFIIGVGISIKKYKYIE